MSFSDRVAGWIWDRSRTLLGLCALVTLVAAWHAGKVGVDNSLAIWFVEDDPQLVAYSRFQEQFGNDEIVVIAFHQPAGMLTRAGLALLKRAETRLRAVEGVASVLSVNASRFEDAPEDNALRRRILADDRLRDRLVSRDGTTAALVARMQPAGKVDNQRDAILERIERALGELGAPSHKAGIGVLYAALNRLSIVDAFALFCGALLVMFFLLWAILGRAVAALTALGIAATATLWTLGLYGAAGRSLNMVTTVMPTVILVVGIAEVVHILLHAAGVPRGTQPRERAVAVMGFMLKPCTLNVLTSAVGFASLAFAPMPAVRDLGLFTAAGLAGCLVLTVVGGTVALRWPRCEPMVARSGWLTRAALYLCEVGIRRPGATLAAGALIAACAIVAASQIVVDTFTLHHLDSSHPVRRDAEFIEARLGPYLPLDFVVRGRDGRVDRELLEGIERWQRDAAGLPGLGGSRSLVDDFHRATGSTRMDDARLAPFLAAYRESPFATLDPRLGEDGGLRVTFALRNQSAKSAEAALRAVRDRARLPEGAEVIAAGYIPLYIRMVDYIVDSQIAGFAVAFAAVFAVIALAFRSLGIAALAIPGNLLPLLAVFAAMGIAGIRLDIATATVASVVLGLVVDDTVHLLHRLRGDLARFPDPQAALRETARHAGRAILATTLVMALGFSVFALSEIRSVVYFGLLIALAMGASAIADLLVVPALVTLLASRSRHAYRAA